MRAILTYHSIDGSGSVISTAPARFAEQVRWLAGSSVAALPLGTLVTGSDGAPALAVTFDDGFANLAEAWPLLRDQGVPATVFVATDHVGRDNGWPQPRGLRVPRLPLLDWDDLGRMAEEGLDVGSHTRTHADLGTASDDEARSEVEESAEVIAARIGRRPTAFAYPYGSYAGAAVRAVAAIYAFGCTTHFRLLESGADRHALPRLDAYYFRAPGSLEAWGTMGCRLRVALRGLARRVREGVTGG